MVQSPSRYDPVNDKAEADQAAQHRAEAHGRSSGHHQGRRRTRREGPARPEGQQPKNGCITAVNGAGFFCDYVASASSATRPSARPRSERGEGLEQRRPDHHDHARPAGAEVASRASLKATSTRPTSSPPPTTIVQPGTGKILAMGQSQAVRLRQERDQLNCPSTRNMGGSASASRPARPSSRSRPPPPWRRGCKPRQDVPVADHDGPYPDRPDVRRQAVGHSQDDGTRERERVGGRALSMPDALKHSINTYFVALDRPTSACARS